VSKALTLPPPTTPAFAPDIGTPLPGLPEPTGPPTDMPASESSRGSLYRAEVLNMPITDAPPEVTTLLSDARSEGMPRLTRLLR
jgi:hypothetical protein